MSTDRVYDTLYLAPSEHGTDRMRELAQEYFDRHPACEFLEVHEHGGWFIGYRRDGSIWDTANTTAGLDPGARPAQWSGNEIKRSDFRFMIYAGPCAVASAAETFRQAGITVETEGTQTVYITRAAGTRAAAARSVHEALSRTCGATHYLTRDAERRAALIALSDR